MNKLTYRGYSARVEFDDEDGILVGRISGITDFVGFHADSVPKLTVAFHEAVNDYVATCTKIGKEPEKAYSGRVMFRIPPDLHRAAATAAELSGVSLNKWAERVMRAAVRWPAEGGPSSLAG